MKAAFFGNICNNLYQIVKALRKFSDIDAQLFIDSSSDQQQRPESDDPILKDSYPSWIHKGAYLPKGFSVMPWRSPLIQELNKFDFIVLSGPAVALVPFIKKPCAFYVTGGDLTVTPFPIEFGFLYATLRKKIWALFTGFWQRRGIRRCAQIWTRPYAPLELALEKLKINPSIISPGYFPLIIDTHKFVRDEQARESRLPYIRDLVDHFDFIIFHPTRMMITADAHLRSTGQWKKNDALFEGFAQFLKDNGHPKVGLVVPERSASPDVSFAKELIRTLGIEKNVVWLKPPRPFGFTRDEMIPLYSISDIVVDDCGVGWLGSVVLEACSLKCPIMNYVDAKAMKKLYAWHPLISATTPTEITGYLTDLFKNPNRRQQAGQDGRRWVEEFHSEKAASKIFAEHLNAVVSQ